MAKYRGAGTIRWKASDGRSPYIGANGNWWQWNSTVNDFVDTGVKAAGVQGMPGKIPFQKEWRVGDTHRNNTNIVDYIYVRAALAENRKWYKLNDTYITRTVPAGETEPSAATIAEYYEEIPWLSALAVNVLIAEEANLANFIFKEGKLISIRGTVGGVAADYAGQANFIPNIVIDGKTGQIIAVNANITGTINATSGTFTGGIVAATVGGWIIEPGHIGVSHDSELNGSNGISLWDDFVRFYKKYTSGNPPNSYAWAGIGTNVLPASSGASAVGRFENHEQQGVWGTELITYYTYSSYQSAGSPTPATFYYTVWDDEYETGSHTETFSFYIPPEQMNYYFTYGGELLYIKADTPKWYTIGGTTNYGIIIDVDGAAENIGIDIVSGVIAGLALKAKQISAGYTLTKEDVYVSCYNTSTITVYLPANPQTGKTVFVHRVNAANVTVNGNGKLISWGVGTGSTRGVGDGSGDTAVVVYDGQYWMWNYLIRGS